MLKCDIDSTQINFDDLELGSTFRIKTEDYEWYGMKVCCDVGDVPIYYIMDMSDDVGKLYDDVDKYNIVALVDLKVVRDEGER